MQQIELFLKSSLGFGKNPYTVNVISYSGQGFSYHGDEIAVIPEYIDPNNIHKGTYARFINFSGLARKFAEKKNSINIFILSKCRVFLS
jgi:hypothetical protein